MQAGHDELRKQVAIVTGAGRGLGRAIARALAQAGAAAGLFADDLTKPLEQLEEVKRSGLYTLRVRKP